MDVPFLIFLAICLAITVFTGRYLLSGIRSGSWPSVEGTVTSSRVERAITPTKGGSTTSRAFRIRYSFSVDGSSYSGDRVSIAPRGWFSNSSPSLQSKYPDGATVTVHYDPGNPSVCTLVPGVLHNWPLHAIGGMFAAFTLLMLIRLIRG